MKRKAREKKPEVVRRMMVTMVLVIMAAVSGRAQMNGLLHFESFTTNNKCVYACYRDADGILWMGTSQGLMTYAELQSQFPIYYRYGDALTNVIIAINQDNTGRLWLRTQALRYIVYNPRTNECINDLESYLRQIGINVRYQFYVYIDKEGRVWVYKDNKVYCKDFKTGALHRLTLPYSTGAVVKMTDEGGTMTIVTRDAVYDLNGNKLVKKMSTPEPITRFETYLTVDKGGSMWMASNMQLFRYSDANHKWTVFPEVKPDITGMLSLPNGEVYVATTNNGLFVFDSQGNIKSNILQTAPRRDGLMNSHLQALYYDQPTASLLVSYHKAGMSLWMGQNSNGIKKMYIQSPEHDYIVEDIISFDFAGQNLIAGTEGDGIYGIAPDGSLVWNKYAGNAVTAVMNDSEGKIWTGIYHGGLASDDGRLFFPGMSPYKIIQPKETPGKLFVILNGMGIWRLDPATGTSDSIPTDNPWIMDMVETGGKIYAATPKYLYVINPVTLNVDTIPVTKFPNSGISNGTKAITADSRGWVWIANYKSNTPVDIYDPHTGHIMQVVKLNNYDVKGIVEDEEGNMWCTTDRGLVCVRVIDKDAPAFSLNLFPDKSLYNDRAVKRLPDGRIVVGTTDGYELFNPKTLLGTSGKIVRECPLILASLHINGNNITPNDSLKGRKIISADLPYTHEIYLNYNENNVTLEYLPRNIGMGNDRIWRYRVSGLHNGDQPLVGGRITLSNLSPGTYDVEIFDPNSNKEKVCYKVMTIHIAYPLWLSWWAFLIYIAIATVVGYLTYVLRHSRIAYRRRIDNMKEEARREKAIDDMKINFFANVSHDLRTPLTLIIAPVEDLIDKARDNDTKSILIMVHKNAQRLYSLVNQILDFRKIGIGGQKFQLQTVDIVGLVRGATDTFRLMAQSQKIKLTMTASDSNILTTVDVDKITKVVMNLLSNAFKFTPAGGNISVEVRREDGKVVIVVADTGTGIPHDKREKIFERGYTSASEEYNTEGQGLGLSIVKSYVEMHQGTIAVTGNDPQGAVFTVCLPDILTDVDTGRGDIPTPALKNQSSTETSKTLLLVEDNTDLLSYMGHVLEKEYTVCQSTDGSQALDILKTTHVDIIVSDVMMEGMDGMELCRRVKTDITISHIPLILLTARALDADQLKGLQLGADDYITKPFNFEILRQRIRNILQRTERAKETFKNEIEVKPSAITVTTLDEEFIAKAIKIVEENMKNADFSVDDLAGAMSMHRTSLYKKILAITGQTPLLFIRSLKMKRAHQMMSRGGVRVAQVAYEVGFNSPKIFARYFKEEYGVTPTEFMRQNE
jgi:signal transduction histidine kinase/DNA-binding response OmpR family regulator/ligand-binding sensor domain-containing protein